MKLRISTPEENRKLLEEYYTSPIWLEYCNSLTPEQKHLNDIRREYYRIKNKEAIENLTKNKKMNPKGSIHEGKVIS